MLILFIFVICCKMGLVHLPATESYCCNLSSNRFDKFYCPTSFILKAYIKLLINRREWCGCIINITHMDTVTSVKCFQPVRVPWPWCFQTLHTDFPACGRNATNTAVFMIKSPARHITPFCLHRYNLFLLPPPTIWVTSGRLPKRVRYVIFPEKLFPSFLFWE